MLNDEYLNAAMTYPMTYWLQWPIDIRRHGLVVSQGPTFHTYMMVYVAKKDVSSCTSAQRLIQSS